MMKKIYASAASLIIVGLITALPAFASNGYFSHGYGMKAKGMAGVGIALPQDSIAAATNPAGMVLVGDRFDLGMDWFKPNRNTVITSPTAAAGTYSGNGKSSFLIPEFGYNKMIDADASVGISVFGNGGMNTQYKTLNAGTTGTARNFGTGDAGVNLEQLFIAPTWALKLNPANAVGISFHYAYQKFKAEGLQNPNFGIMNPGTDSSSGWGFRLGWIGKVTPKVTLGATYQPKTEMSRFSKYAGLFAEQGGFDIPANYGVGLAVKVNNATTVAADLQRILYGRVNSIANTGNTSVPLGQGDGPGFGWRNMNIVKLGVSHRYRDNLQVRAGFSTGTQPIPATETYFNILSPGVVQHHLTLGATWTIASKHELTLGYAHALKKTVTGAGPTSGINLNMSQNAFGIAYGKKM